MQLIYFLQICLSISTVKKYMKRLVYTSIKVSVITVGILYRKIPSAEHFVSSLRYFLQIPQKLEHAETLIM